jgi:hypothetical protein
LSLGTTFSQNDWLYTFNSNSTNTDYPTHHVVDNQGNVYVTGSTTYQGNRGFIMKISYYGAVTWIKYFTGYNGGEAEGLKVVLDNNGNAFICASGKGFNNNRDFWLLKYDAAGNNLFQVRHGDPYNEDHFGDAVFNSAGELIVSLATKSAPDTTYNGVLIKYNSSGIPQLYDAFDAPLANIYPIKLLIDAQGSIFMCTNDAYVQPYSWHKMGIRKYNSQFQIQSGWNSGFNSTRNDYLFDAELMMGTDIILCGSLGNSSGGRDFGVIKLNNFLNTIWTKSYNFASGDETANDLAVDNNNNIILCGNIINYQQNAMTVKLNIDGLLVWSKVYDREGMNDYVYKVAVDSFGNAYSAGYSSSNPTIVDAMILKYDVNGNFQFVYNYNGFASGIDLFNSFSVSPNGIITACGSVVNLFNNATNVDVITVRLTGHVTGVNGASSEIPEGFSLSQNYPNPFNPSTKISFSIPKSSFVKMAVYDVTGKEVEILVNENVNAGTFEVDFNASKLTSGVYFCKITAGDFTDVKKMILTK